MSIEQEPFRLAFQQFTSLVKKYDRDHPFTNFSEGLVAAFEEYKPRLRDYARSLLALDDWTEAGIGTGGILERVIASVEIQDSRKNLTNNLVFWQNRYGHATREHRALLEARNDKNAQYAIEKTLFELYRTDNDEAIIFDRLSELLDRKYPLLAYLFFLKDINRFCPIQPTGYDRAFRELGVNLTTLRNCSSENYFSYNEVLREVRSALENVAGLKNVRLIDAHSFCWVYVTLLRRDAEAIQDKAKSKSDPGRVVEARERCIVNMKYSIIQTAQQAQGQIVDRLVQMKTKNLGLDPYALEAYLKELMQLQGDRCALTGIRFQFDGSDTPLLPSADRIDSNGHYVRGNIQIVCRFINFWKRDSTNEEFMRLLSLIRGEEEDNLPSLVS
jgi:hypothetical protein